MPGLAWRTSRRSGSAPAKSDSARSPTSTVTSPSSLRRSRLAARKSGSRARRTRRTPTSSTRAGARAPSWLPSRNRWRVRRSGQRGLQAAGIRAVECDLGEYILQLAHEHPIHIILPAIEKTAADVAELFSAVEGEPVSPQLEELAAAARRQLRKVFLADVGLTGANFGIAQTGSICLVTNEGNGGLSRRSRRCTSPSSAWSGSFRPSTTWRCYCSCFPAARPASLTSYTRIISGPRREGEVDGPEELHVVILDNGRSNLRGGRYEEMLSCIRCGACLNVCPVYRKAGGGAYGPVYSGPMAAVLVPLLVGLERAPALPHASSLCGVHRGLPGEDPPPRTAARASQGSGRGARRFGARAARFRALVAGLVPAFPVSRLDVLARVGARRPAALARAASGRGGETCPPSPPDGFATTNEFPGRSLPRQRRGGRLRRASGTISRDRRRRALDSQLWAGRHWQRRPRRLAGRAPSPPPASGRACLDAFRAAHTSGLAELFTAVGSDLRARSRS